MKRACLSILIAMCYWPAFCQYRFTLNLKTKTLSDTIIYLEIYNNRNYLPLKIDSFRLVKGQHTINGEVKQPSNFAALAVKDDNKGITTKFVLDSGENNVSLDTPITRSMSLTLHSDARGDLVFKDLNNLFLEMAAHYKEPTRVNGYLRISQELSDQIKQAQLKRLRSYPNDFGSLIYLYRLSRIDALPGSAKDNLNTLSTFSDELQNSELGKELYAEETDLIKNKIAARAGNVVPVFKVTDIQNNLFSNSSLEGQPYLIVFSATWCGPCQKQLPKLKKLYQAYKQRGLKVVYFNDDDNVTRWKEHVSKNRLNWINVSEKLKPSVSKIPTSFGVYSVPTCLIINKKGIIIYNSDESDPDINYIEKFIKDAVDN